MALIRIIPLFVLILSACAPGLGTTLRVDAFEATDATSIAIGGARMRARVGQFLDMRTRKAIGEVRGRELEPAGDVASGATRALEDELKRAGVELSLFEAPILVGEVQQWFVTVTPDFPTSSVEAKAKIRMQVTDKSGKVLYSGLYSGGMSQKHPWLTEDEVSHVLAQAMSFAMREALKDERLLRELQG